MLAMSSQFDRYQEMSALSARMVDAARSGDWDGLLDLERRVAGIRDGLMLGSEKCSEPDPGEPRSARMRDLIQQILDDDAEVRRHTEPWMEQVKLLLSGHRNGWQLASVSDPVVAERDAGGSAYGG